MPSRPPILAITPAAAERIQHLLSAREKPALGVRVGVKSRGCTGLTYTLEYVDNPNPADEIIEAHDVRVFVDPRAVMFVIGTTMDYKDEKISSGFLFINPNEKGRCGCGESFHV